MGDSDDKANVTVPANGDNGAVDIHQQVLAMRRRAGLPDQLEPEIVAEVVTIFRRIQRRMDRDER
jgi:hypothetical protein